MVSGVKLQTCICEKKEIKRSLFLEGVISHMNSQPNNFIYYQKILQINAHCEVK